MRALGSILGVLVLGVPMLGVLVLGVSAPVAAQSDPTVVATFEEHGAQIDFRLLVSEGHVYLLQARGGTHIAPDGERVPWFRLEDYSPPHGAQIVGSHIVWAAGLDTFRRRRGETRILQIDRGGSTPRELARVDGRACGLVVDGRDIFFVDTDRGTLRRLRGGRVSTVARPPRGRVFGPSCNTPMALDADAVYLPSRPNTITGPSQWSVHRVTRVGRGQTTLAVDQQAEVVQREGADVLFYDRLGGPVSRVSAEGGEVTEFVAAERRGSPLVPFGAHLYYARLGREGEPYTIARVPRAGGAPETLHTGDARRVFKVAVDASGIYWLTAGHPPGDCRVEHLGCGRQPMRRTVCDSPDISLLRLPLP